MAIRNIVIGLTTLESQSLPLAPNKVKTQKSYLQKFVSLEML